MIDQKRFDSCSSASLWWGDDPLQPFLEGDFVGEPGAAAHRAAVFLRSRSWPQMRKSSLYSAKTVCARKMSMSSSILIMKVTRAHPNMVEDQAEILKVTRRCGRALLALGQSGEPCGTPFVCNVLVDGESALFRPCNVLPLGLLESASPLFDELVCMDR